MLRTMSILETLLAPKTLWTEANLWGSWGEKYGEKGHSWAHLLLKSLQAAHGVMVLSVPGGACNEVLLPIICWGWIFDDTSVSLFIFFAISSNLSLHKTVTRRKTNYSIIITLNSKLILVIFSTNLQTNENWA